jgi:hypothetical protein
VAPVGLLLFLTLLWKAGFARSGGSPLWSQGSNRNSCANA